MDGSAAKPGMLEEPSVKELVAKAIAPVKKEFLRPPPIRPPPSTTRPDDAVSEHKSASLVKEKKSKRQLKRECHQELKSALHLCPEVAKSGQVGSCCYGEKCRFSHDVEAFKAQKPADLEGNCPFVEIDQGLCPYGLACRFAASLKYNGVAAAGTLRNEVNSLNKDVQKLLWKNKMKFPKADATLKLLGLSEK